MNELEKKILEDFLIKGFTKTKMSLELGISKDSIRTKLKKYNLYIPKFIRTPSIKTDNPNKKVCALCKIEKDLSEFYKTVGKYRHCKLCMHKDSLSKRRNNKIKIVEYLGGKCSKCSYSHCIAALHIHHLDPTLKSLKFENFKTRSFDDKLKQELDTCILLCANCHAEEHYCS